MDTSQIVTNLVATLIIFGFATFFVISEFALVQTRPSQLEDMITNKEGNLKKLKRALHMVHNLNEYLSTTQVGTTLVGVVLGWFSTDTLSELIIRGLKFSPLGESLAKSVGAVLGVLLLTYLEVVFTEIVPKNIAIDMPVKMLMVIVTPLKCFHTLVYPFVWILNTSSNGVLKLMGFKEAAEENEIYSQSEIIKLSRLAVTGGALDKEDLKYMERAFELNDKVAKDIMTDRTRLTVLDATDTVKTALKLYLDEGFSRFPVVRDNDKDDVVGYVYAYDIVEQSNEGNNASLSRLIRAIITVPESMPIQDILQLMIQKHTPIVLVVDEYGGTSGIVTDKDIYEELFGSIKDEIDDVSDEYIIRDKDGKVRVSGKTTLYDFERFYHEKLKAFQDSDIITIGGYMMEHYPDLKKGDSVTVEGYKFEVAEIEQGFMRWFNVEKLNDNSKSTE
ncbi:hemolysin family protein [Lactobacillus mulieris]|uniref:Hemolysin family protein n=1 Tax=Lactobacillus mulieris TaxID=2508708 RepID=A0AAW5WZA5_9LACO|nr:hemolysin family protein [Lactobacillus mulieris]MCZ3622578.1 hemolysin family protein [Lactobacillus mulieris]MCZ3624216.1 hemolysin family protein [Lactobacillus mulieris]MCZ3636585.1 hemolysin family protein [Lactobacillus mulieris]MCZ3690354.1 hemolysin family protein [Lactobacillus mulieris]MCZ3696323.1 hemolysin family protein [Lactobacillus mulieris]